MPQTGYPLGKAHKALDDFLADGTPGQDGERQSLWISTHPDDPHSGEPLAYIVSAAEYHRMHAGCLSQPGAERPRKDDRNPPPGYRPWQHSPAASTERLLPTWPLHDHLALALCHNMYDELGPHDKARVRAHATACLLQVQLDPDGQSVVPVMTAGHDGDDPGAGTRWQLAFLTDVPGLFTRVTSSGWFGAQWSLITGSGYRIHSGWLSRDGAATCAGALGRALPNVSWMRLAPQALSPAALDTVRATVERYGPWSRPEARGADPDPLAETAPPQGDDAGE